MSQNTSDNATSPRPTHFAQVAMRHYAGYASGLALALFAATLFDDERAALTATLIAFFAGKAASDFLVPAVYYTTSPQSPRTVGQFIVGILFAVMWWGIPLGALLALAIDIEIEGAGLPDYLIAFAATSIGTMIFSVFIHILLRLTQGREAQTA